jgi:hypothetical protein
LQLLDQHADDHFARRPSRPRWRVDQLPGKLEEGRRSPKLQSREFGLGLVNSESLHLQHPWPGIAGVPLAQVIGALGEYVPASSPAAYMFFMSPDDLLGYLTPIEALIGQVIFTTDREPTTAELLTLPHDLRVEVVVGAARAYAACSNA